MRSFWQDLRFGARMLRRSPGFVCAAVLLLALGIGANAAIFSVLDLILLKAFPYRDAHRLVMLWETNPGLGEELVGKHVPVALRNYQEWERAQTVFSAMGYFQETGFNLTGRARPERIDGVRASAGLFNVLGVKPALGRLFGPSDGGRTAVLSHSAHRRLFGGDPQALGRTLALNGALYTVAGVLPPEFSLPVTWGGASEKNPGVWVPFEIDPARPEELNHNGNSVFARLKDGATVARAREELKAISLRLARERGQRNTAWSATAVTLREEEAGPDLRSGLLMLQVAVGFVLLIACANLANLLLARMASREREIAVRAALGAGRLRLVRQLLSESMLLALLGALAGLGVALVAIRAVAAAAPSDLERLAQLRLNWRVFGFTLAAALASGIVSGLAPALHGVRASLFGALRGGAGRHAGRRALLAVQVALAMVLLAGAGVMIRSLAAVLENRPGFRGDVLTFRINLPLEKYRKAEDLKAFCRQYLERLERLPGVTSAALANGLPMQTIQLFGFHVEGRPMPSGQMLFADYRTVTPRYFETLGIPLLRGRLFTRHEPEKDIPVIVNEAFARRFWPGENPIGKALVSPRGPSVWRREVVGLVADTRQFKLEAAPRAEVFFPLRGEQEIAAAVRTAGPPMALADAAKAEAWAIDKDQPVIKVGVLDRWIRDSVSMRRFHVLVLGIFALVSLVLAATGIYGLLAWSVGCRTREIGVRMALGAAPGHVLRATMREGLVPVAAGMAVGGAGAIALTRLLRALLYGVTPGDPATYAAVCALLALAATVAVLLPARRATRIDPSAALRHE